MLKAASFFKEERDPFYRRGQARGIEKGIEKGKASVVASLLAAGKFTISEIANFATVSEDFVKKVHSDLDKKNK